MCRSMVGKVVSTLVVVLLLLMSGSSQDSPACTTGRTRLQWPRAFVMNHQILQRRTNSSMSFLTLVLLVICMRTLYFLRRMRTIRRRSTKNLHVRNCDVLRHAHTHMSEDRRHAHVPTSEDAQAWDDFLDWLQSDVAKPNCQKTRFNHRRSRRSTWKLTGEPWRGFHKEVLACMGQLPSSRKAVRQRQSLCNKRRKRSVRRAQQTTLSHVSCEMMAPYPLTEKLVLPLTMGVASTRTLTDRRFVSATRYSTRRHDKAAIKKGLRVSTQTPPEHKPKHREQPLPKLVWAQSRKEANRIVHALNGNVHMIGSPKTTTASGSWATTGSRGDKRYQNVCLVDSLRSLGVKLQYTADGPFWALSDGNAMLSAFGKVLRPADKKDLTKIGKYIIYGNGHFVSVSFSGQYVPVSVMPQAHINGGLRGAVG